MDVRREFVDQLLHVASALTCTSAPVTTSRPPVDREGDPLAIGCCAFLALSPYLGEGVSLESSPSLPSLSSPPTEPGA